MSKYLTAAMATLLYANTAFAAPDPNFHIYLMIGQSNMEGTAPIQAQDRSSHPRVKVMQGQNCGNGVAYGSWREATPPLIRCANLGPGDTFGDTLAENAPENITIGLVGLAYGGAQIESFFPDCSSYSSKDGKPNACYPPYGDIAGAPQSGGTTPMYEWIMDLAGRAQQDGVIKGFIFHQGESNSGQQDWPQKVNKVVQAIRSDLGLSAAETPFIAGELPHAGCCNGHNSIIRNIPGVIENSYVVSGGPENGSALGLVDQYHWDSAAVRVMGRRYAEEMMKHISYGPVDCGTSDAGNPICCNISADPDADGWGTQNEGESCEVTPDTAGYVPPNPDDVVAAINVGSTQGDSFDNIYYQADVNFSGGDPNSTSDSIQGAGGSAIFTSERYGDISYEIPVSNGSYSVELYFVEMYWEAAGERSFNVNVEGNSAYNNLDIFSEVGHDSVYTTDAITVNVTDSSLSIDIETVTDNGTLSGILVRKLGNTSSSSSSSSSSVASSSSSSTTSSTASSSSSSAPATTGGAFGFKYTLLFIAIALTAIRGRRKNVK